MQMSLSISVGALLTARERFPSLIWQEHVVESSSRIGRVKNAQFFDLKIFISVLEGFKVDEKRFAHDGDDVLMKSDYVLLCLGSFIVEI